MGFAPMTTSAALLNSNHKVLMYAPHGWGKTTQAIKMQERYGAGFIMSGEGGLRSLGATEIDYLPFTSYDGEHDHDKGVYSFIGTLKDMHSKEFKSAGYNWLMIDSLTELSDLLLKHLEEEFKGDKNTFKVWGEYATRMIGVLKLIRDMDYHVVVTSLAKDETNSDGETDYWPAIKGNAVNKQLCGIFDHVFAGVRKEIVDEEGERHVKRYIVTDELRGYHGKVRDPYHNVASFMECDDITRTLDLIGQVPSKV